MGFHGVWEGEAAEIELLTSSALTPGRLTFANLLTSGFGCLFFKTTDACSLFLLLISTDWTTPSCASNLWSLFLTLDITLCSWLPQTWRVWFVCRLWLGNNSVMETLSKCLARIRYETNHRTLFLCPLSPLAVLKMKMAHSRPFYM